MTKGNRYFPSGLTLIELIVAMTIMSVVVAIALAVVMHAQRVQEKLERKQVVAAEINRVIDRIEKTIKTSREFLACSDAGIAVLDQKGDTINIYINLDTLFMNGRPMTCLSVMEFAGKCLVTQTGDGDHGDGHTRPNCVETSAFNYDSTQEVVGCRFSLKFRTQDNKEITRHSFVALKNVVMDLPVSETW